MIWYLTKHPEVKAKLMQEVLPKIEKVKDDIMGSFDYETVMDFDYMQQVFYETMRIESPLAFSIT